MERDSTDLPDGSRYEGANTTTYRTGAGSRRGRTGRASRGEWREGRAPRRLVASFPDGGRYEGGWVKRAERARREDRGGRDAIPHGRGKSDDRHGRPGRPSGPVPHPARIAGCEAGAQHRAGKRGSGAPGVRYAGPGPSLTVRLSSSILPPFPP